MKTKFLDYTIEMTCDGVTIVDKNGCNPMPGACNFGKVWNKKSIDSAKKSALQLFMIDRPEDFGAALYWKLNKRKGAYLEWFTLKKVLERESIEMPEELKKSVDSLNFMIGFNNELV